jgi:hypothetical protein
LEIQTLTFVFQYHSKLLQAFCFGENFTFGVSAALIRVALYSTLAAVLSVQDRSQLPSGIDLRSRFARRSVQA